MVYNFMKCDDKVVEYYAKLGFASLTEIQKMTYAKVMCHDLDLLVAAPTGSGKTEAVIVPLFVKLTNVGFLSSEGIAVLYITPLRALNRDLKKRLSNICNIFNCSVDVWHGDTSYSVRKRIVKVPPHILLTTPESLQILLIRKELTRHLSKLYAIIIDEAQELIQDERGLELLLAIERLENMLKRHVRRIALTTALDEKNLRLIGEAVFFNRHYEIALANTKKRYDVSVKLSNESYQAGFFSTDDIIKKIIEVIKSGVLRQILVFTNTRTSAEELSYLLKSKGGLEENIVGLHHGSLSKSIREAVERSFKEGQIKVVVATSSLELGIDIGKVDFVIQYLSPRQVSRLLQRIGRAGHREDEMSKGVIISPPIISELVESLIIAKRLERGNLEPLNIHINSLDVLAHQFVGLALEQGSVTLTSFWKMARRVAAFQGISFDVVEKLAQFLNDIGLVTCRKDEQELICSPTKRGYIYYVTTNMIPDASEFYAKSVIDHKVIASLDEDFVALCNQDDVVVLGGKAWQVVDVNYDERTVWLTPLLNAGYVTLPRWVGENIPVYEKVVRETCSFFRRLCSCKDETCLDKLFTSYKLDEAIRRFIVVNMNNICRVYPSDNVLTVELYEVPNDNKSFIAVYHCLGSKGSEAFSLLLLRILREYLNTGGSYKSHQIGTVILTNRSISTDELKKVLSVLIQLNKSGSVREAIIDELKKSSLFKKRIIEVAKRMGIIAKNSSIEEIKRIFNVLLNMELLVNETIRELLTENLDVETVENFLQRLNKNRKIRIVVTKTASPFLQEITQLGSLRYIIKSSMLSRNMIIEIAKRRLLNRKTKLICLICNYVFEIDINEYLTEKCIDKNPFKCPISCPHCGSKSLAVVESDNELQELKNMLIKLKKEEHLKINVVELKNIEKFLKVANLVMDYGLAALVTLNGIGIGVEFAKRILAKSHDWNSLISNILEYEESYLRTRKYWS
jgi:ATP-dependent Lhr-like helicase